MTATFKFLTQRTCICQLCLSKLISRCCVRCCAGELQLQSIIDLADAQGLNKASVQAALGESQLPDVHLALAEQGALCRCVPS